MKKAFFEREWRRQVSVENAYRKKRRSGRGIVSDKIPEKARNALEFAFEKAFIAVLRKGNSLIDASISKESKEDEHQARKTALLYEQSRKSLKNIGESKTTDIALTGLWGAALGTLGIGLPDIPLFFGRLLRAVYEIAVEYGYSYDNLRERYFILELIRASLSYGESFEQSDDAVNAYIDNGSLPQDYQPDMHIKACAKAMANDMLLSKFIQGIPIVGAVGGTFDAVFVSKIIKYVKMKYKRRFLLDLKKNGELT